MTDRVTHLLKRLGEEFAAAHSSDGPRAWTALMTEIMKNAHLLADSGIVGDLHSIVAIARDIEDHVRVMTGKKGTGGTGSLPLDVIGDKWRVQQSSEVE